MVFVFFFIFILFLIITGSYISYLLGKTGNSNNYSSGSFHKSKANPKTIHDILNRHHNYYKRLSQGNKYIFERRVQKFIRQKTFIPKDMPSVTDTMSVMIGGAAIQLSFGHPGVYFQHFDKIFVFPDNYYSRHTDKYHQGEVNAGGYIVLSWKNFVRGYMDDSDGRNLGLHEMAHALHLENAIINREYDFLDDEMLLLWTRLSHEEMDKILNDESHFFRYYAATNIHEFFAVAVENFFERPDAFKEYNEELYTVLCRLLNQDPLKLLTKPSGFNAV